VLHLAQELLPTTGQPGFGGLAGLLNTSADDLKRIKGLGGPAKRAELVAVLELARRAVAQR
jgi:DNA repair protein RadC